MRKGTCILVALCLLFSCTALAQAPGNRLGVRALEAMNDGRGNRAVSPASLMLALAMAAEGAEGETRSEILTTLELEDLSDLTALADALSGAGLKIANAAFVRPDLPVLDAYRETLLSGYDAEWMELDGAAQARINEWVSRKTDGLIEKLLDAEPDPNIVLTLVNAVAFDADWRIPFLPESSVEETFHAPDGDTSCMFMHNSAYYDYAEVDGTQVVRLAYADSALSMYIALPREGGVSDLLDALGREGIAALGEMSQDRKVELALPKFSVASGGSLRGTLMEQMPGMFSSQADFSGISEEPVFVDDVIQKVRIDVDERGTRAAAATAVAMACGAMIEEEPIAMTVDRPFLAVIAEPQTGVIAFLAVVANPSTQE